MQKPIREQKAVLVILLSNIFIAFLGIGLIIPVMPLFMNVMHLTGSTMGYLVAAFAVAQLIASPIAGRWVDRYGRKIMIVSGLFLFALSELVFGLGTHVYVLYVARLLGGISAAFIMPAVTAYVADITTVQERSKAMGYVSAAISTGFIIGPGIGGFIAEYGVRLPFFFAAGIAFIAVISSMFMLKEPLTKEEREKQMNEVKESTFFKDLKNQFIQATSSPLSLCLSSHLDYLHMKQSLACSQIISLDLVQKILPSSLPSVRLWQSSSKYLCLVNW